MDINKESLHRVVEQKTARASQLRHILTSHAINISSAYSEAVAASTGTPKPVMLSEKDVFLDVFYSGGFLRLWSILEGLVTEAACLAGIQRRGKTWRQEQAVLEPGEWKAPLNSVVQMQECLSAKPEWAKWFDESKLFEGPLFQVGSELRNVIAHRDGLPGNALIKLFSSADGLDNDRQRPGDCLLFGRATRGDPRLAAWELLTLPVLVDALPLKMRAIAAPNGDHPSGATVFANIIPWAVTELGAGLLEHA